MGASERHRYGIPALILALVLWRLGLAGLLPVTQDEAYYADWARHLAWGYFDHPPGVALLGLGTWLVPGSGLALRLGTLLAGILTLLVLNRFYRHAGLTAPRDRALALLLAAATLPGLAGGVLNTPDTVLALAWALTLHEAERALAGDRRRWLTAGLAAGLGLLGKYPMALIGPALLWAILRSDPRSLRTPWPWLGGGLALLVFLPHLVWNAQHDWLTLRFQLGHGFAADLGTLAAGQTIDHGGAASLGERLASLAGYLGTQLALWGLLAIPLFLAFRPRPAPPVPLAPHARPLLLAAALVPLGLCALLALRGAVEANWPAMYLLTAAPLLALRLRRWRSWVLTGAGLNLLLVMLYALQAAAAFPPLTDFQHRLLRETHGFAALARAAAGLDAPVHADRYQTAAMLRFHGRALGLSGETSQWPGLARPSEYLRGGIAPRIDPATVRTPFWLVSRQAVPPALPGLRAGPSHTLFDCAGQPLQRTDQPPCPRPLHVWHLHRYARAGD